MGRARVTGTTAPEAATTSTETVDGEDMIKSALVASTTVTTIMAEADLLIVTLETTTMTAIIELARVGCTMIMTMVVGAAATVIRHPETEDMTVIGTTGGAVITIGMVATNTINLAATMTKIDRRVTEIITIRAVLMTMDRVRLNTHTTRDLASSTARTAVVATETRLSLLYHEHITLNN